MTTSEVFDAPGVRKARGAFFTPPEVCDYVVRWALREPTDTLLEPSCGEAAFMLAGAERLQALGNESPHLVGYEVHAASAARARELLTTAGVARPDVRVGDFLAQPVDETYLAVAGNPPYIRYQGFAGEARQTGLRAALAQGVELTGLASSWAHFVVHSAAFVKPGGRLALVLPAELLSSNYAASVRSFMLGRFASVHVVLFDKHVFPGVQTEALLLLAEGTGGTDEVAFTRVHKASDLEHASVDVVLRPSSPTARWTTALVDAEASDTLASLGDAAVFTDLATWGRINLGAVTGNNKYFTLSRDTAQQLGLSPTDLLSISPPGSAHLRALSLSRRRLASLADDGERTLLFRPAGEPSRAAMEYIREGERLKVDEAYKCRVRTPWWRVPVSAPPDLFFTYMNAETVQLCANPARVRHLNSVHGMYLKDSHKRMASNLALASLNSATMLSAEVVGRSYGGGILKMEPREAVRLAVPSPEVVARLAGELSKVAPKAQAMLRRGDLAGAVSAVDQLVLVEGLAVDPEQVHALRRSRSLLATRRQTRGK